MTGDELLDILEDDTHPLESFKAFTSFLKAESERAERKKRDQKRAAIEADIDKARTLSAEADALTKKLKRYF